MIIDTKNLGRYVNTKIYMLDMFLNITSIELSNNQIGLLTMNEIDNSPTIIAINPCENEFYNLRPISIIKEKLDRNSFQKWEQLKEKYFSTHTFFTTPRSAIIYKNKILKEFYNILLKSKSISAIYQANIDTIYEEMPYLDHIIIKYFKEKLDKDIKKIYQNW